jgi:predicted N-acetyltransferase YhbS
MQIRVATGGDVSALHNLIEGAYRGDRARQGWTHEADLLGGQRTDQAALAAIVADPTQRILVAEVDGVVIGSVLIQSKGEGLAYLGQLAVDPERQANGLGRRLIDAGEACAIDVFGASQIEMTVITQRTELIAYYVRRGYAETGETRPFPLNDVRAGLPKTLALTFTVLAKPLRLSTLS